MLCEVSYRKTNTAWISLICGNPKNKTNENVQTLKKPETVIDTGTKRQLPEKGGRGEEKNRWEIMRDILPVIKQVTHKYKVYSVGSDNNNYVIPLYGDIS